MISTEPLPVLLNKDFMQYWIYHVKAAEDEAMLGVQPKMVETWLNYGCN